MTQGSTAERPRGYFGYLGSPSNRPGEPHFAAPHHMAFMGDAPRRSASDPSVIEAVMAERARRALYADCERLGDWWPRRA